MQNGRNNLHVRNIHMPWSRTSCTSVSCCTTQRQKRMILNRHPQGLMEIQMCPLPVCFLSCTGLMLMSVVLMVC